MLSQGKQIMMMDTLLQNSALNDNVVDLVVYMKYVTTFARGFNLNILL